MNDWDINLIRYKNYSIITDITSLEIINFINIVSYKVAAFIFYKKVIFCCETQTKDIWKQDPEANIWAQEWEWLHNEELHSTYCFT